MRQLDPLGHALRSAGEQDDRRLAGRDAEPRPAKRKPVLEKHAQLGQAGDAFPDVLEVNELDAGRLHRRHVQLGLGQEHARGDDLPQPGQLRAGEHQRHSAGVVEHSRDFSDAPQGKQRDDRAVHVGQQHADPHLFVIEQPPELSAQHHRADHHHPVTQRLAGDVLQHHSAGTLPRPRGDLGEHVTVTVVHLHLKLMLDHPLAKPLRQRLAHVTHAAELPDRRLQHIAEVNAHPGEALLPARVPRPRQAQRVAKVAGDHFGFGFVQQETGSLEQFHQAAGLRDAALGKQNQPAAALQKVGHLLHGKRRGVIHRERVAVDHHEPEHPVAVRPRGRGDEAPVVAHAQPDQPPVEPRHVVGDQQHRPRRVQHAAAVNAKAKQDTGQQSADEADKRHRLGVEKLRRL